MAQLYRAGGPHRVRHATISFNEVVVNRRIASFFVDEEGAALAEYGILIAFIAVVAIMMVTFLGNRISSKFSAFATSLG